MADVQSLLDDLEALKAAALGAVASASGAADLEQVRIDYLGRRDGRISGVLRGLGGMDPVERPKVGARANQVKAEVEQALEARLADLADAGGANLTPALDLSLPGRSTWVGGAHPVSRVMDEIWQVFCEMGFSRARGPEVESEWYNFEALNTPLDHPAADEQDTLYLPGGMLLRSHTSPVQVRTMQAHEPPIRILAPGWVFRRDTYDATHTPSFLQVEGLVVDEGISFVDLRATLAHFAERLWGPGTRVRFRPSFFPFTEPSAEVDVKRVVTHPDGTVEEGEWLEIMGAGMVDPAVLEAAGIDSERYTGFAFGMGPGRIAMLKYGVDDLRTFFDNDMRFLEQFRGRGG
jgi:phenylalanyl-tRNA synthetase alpha chain